MSKTRRKGELVWAGKVSGKEKVTGIRQAGLPNLQHHYWTRTAINPATTSNFRRAVRGWG